MDDANFLNYPSILVVNQEFLHLLSDKWSYSYAVSYRRQHDYVEGFEANPETINQEFRLYGRLSYTVPPGALKFRTTLRQEIRRFYTVDFSPLDERLQLRTRLKSQLAIPLDTAAENSILVSAEALFAITDDRKAGWSRPDYKESRFCLYYCYSPNDLPVAFDIGYMNDLVGYGEDITDSNYLAMDVIIKDIF